MTYQINRNSTTKLNPRTFENNVEEKLVILSEHLRME